MAITAMASSQVGLRRCSRKRCPKKMPRRQSERKKYVFNIAVDEADVLLGNWMVQAKKKKKMIPKERRRIEGKRKRHQ